MPFSFILEVNENAKVAIETAAFEGLYFFKKANQQLFINLSRLLVGCLVLSLWNSSIFLLISLSLE